MTAKFAALCASVASAPRPHCWRPASAGCARSAARTREAPPAAAMRSCRLLNKDLEIIKI